MLFDNWLLATREKRFSRSPLLRAARLRSDQAGPNSTNVKSQSFARPYHAITPHSQAFPLAARAEYWSFARVYGTPICRAKLNRRRRHHFDGVASLVRLPRPRVSNDCTFTWPLAVIGRS